MRRTGRTHRDHAYDPHSGRFTQEDPIGLAGGLNLYGFANGDPVNFADPFGLSADCKGFAACLAELGRMTARGFVAGADPTGLTPFDPEKGQGQAGYALGKLASVVGGAGRVKLGSSGAGLVDDVAVAAGETRVTRWMSEGEFAAMRSSGNLQYGAGGRASVGTFGQPRVSGSGPVRVDFNVPTQALQQGVRADWFFILDNRRIPINGITRIQ